MIADVIAAIDALMVAQSELSGYVVRHAYLSRLCPSGEDAPHTLRAACDTWSKPHVSFGKMGNTSDTIPGIICVNPGPAEPLAAAVIAAKQKLSRVASDYTAARGRRNTPISVDLANAAADLEPYGVKPGVRISLRQLTRKLLIVNDIDAFALRYAMSHRVEPFRDTDIADLYESISDSRRALYSRRFAELSDTQRTSLRYFRKEGTLRYLANVKFREPATWTQYHVASPLLCISRQPPSKIKLPEAGPENYRPKQRVDRKKYTPFIEELSLYVQT